MNFESLRPVLFAVTAAAFSGTASAANCHQECVLPLFNGGCGQWTNVCLPDRLDDLSGLPAQFRDALEDIERETSTKCSHAVHEAFYVNSTCALAVAAAIKTGNAILWIGAGERCRRLSRSVERLSDDCGSNLKIQEVAPTERRGRQFFGFLNQTGWPISSFAVYPAHLNEIEGRRADYFDAHRFSRESPMQTNNWYGQSLDLNLGCIWKYSAGYRPNGRLRFAEGTVDLCRTNDVKITP